MNTFFRPLNGIQWLTLVLLCVVTAGFIFGFTTIESVQGHQNDALRSIICFVQKHELANPRLSAAQKREAVVFWKQALSSASLAPCAPY